MIAVGYRRHKVLRRANVPDAVEAAPSVITVSLARRDPSNPIPFVAAWALQHRTSRHHL